MLNGCDHLNPAPAHQIGTVLAASAAAIAVGLTEPLWSVGTAHLVSSYCHFQEGTFVPAELTLRLATSLLIQRAVIVTLNNPLDLPLSALVQMA